MEKRCSKCGETKPLGLAYFRRSQWADGWTAECKACLANRDAARYAADPGKASAYKAAWHAANRERALAQMAAYRAANRDAVCAQKRVHYAVNADRLAKQRAARARERVAATTAWRLANPAKAAAGVARYVAAKLRATPDWANPELVDAYYVLADVLTRTTGVQHHVDHVEPLRGKHVCGLHCEFNLQVLPAKVNISKNNRAVEVRAPAWLGPAPARGA